MRVAIITFNGTNNYGTALQELALNKVIKSFGHEPVTISYLPSFIKKKFYITNIKRWGGKKYFISVVGWFVDRFRIRKFAKFRQNFKHTEWMERNKLLHSLSNYEFYLVGSDQVWNYEATDFDKTFFLDFIDGRKGSYAASIGLNEISEKAAKELKNLLKDFCAISVREKTGQNILEGIGIESQLVLDPTLLLTDDEWQRYAKKVIISKKYIFVYQLGFSKSLLDFAKKLSKQTDCTLLFVPLPMGKVVFGKWKFYIGPAEWLWLLKHAEYVVTDSYHATLFSINFNKNFFVEACRNDICMGSKTGSRIYDILEKYSLTHCLIEDSPNNILTEAVDYSEVNKILETERRMSYDFLKEMLRADGS